MCETANERMECFGSSKSPVARCLFDPLVVVDDDDDGNNNADLQMGFSKR